MLSESLVSLEFSSSEVVVWVVFIIFFPPKRPADDSSSYSKAEAGRFLELDARRSPAALPDLRARFPGLASSSESSSVCVRPGWFLEPRGARGAALLRRSHSD